MIYRFIIATLLAQGAAAAGRQLESCNTSDIATCFANVVSGGDIDLTPGTMNTWDGIYSNTQLSLQSKYASIACSEDGGVCAWQGATGKRVVYIVNNGGTSTLEGLTIKDGDAAGNSGGGLYVQNSNVVLIIVAFIDNAASYDGGAISVYSGSTVTLQGCSFAGNTASRDGPNVYNNGQSVVISGCPAGEDKPTRPSPPFVPSLTNSPPLPLSPLLSSPLPPPLFAGYAQTQGSALSNYNEGGTMNSPAYSYTCTAPVSCTAGTFGQSGRAPCTDCSAGKSSNKAATSCDITCQAGQFTPGGTPCETCPAGSYGPFTEAESCISCPADTYSPKEAVTSKSACKDCLEGRTSEKGAASCDILSPSSSSSSSALPIVGGVAGALALLACTIF